MSLWEAIKLERGPKGEGNRIHIRERTGPLFGKEGDKWAERERQERRLGEKDNPKREQKSVWKIP